MDESKTAENNKQNGQKPPLSVGRIASEILAGTAAGLGIPVAVLAVCYVLGSNPPEDCFGVGGLVALVYAFLIIPPVYALGTVVGVYLVGSRGKQTGSFLLTLGGGFVGGLGMLMLLPFAFYLLTGSASIKNSDLIVQSIVLLAFVLLFPPLMATLGFNWKRRYKEPPSS